MGVLDMHLGTEDSFPVAERLRKLNIPFLFAMGYGSNLVRPETMQDIQLLTKPEDVDILEKALDVLRGS